jgi:hypothetical protein
MGAVLSIIMGIIYAPVVIPMSYFLFRNNKFMNNNKLKIFWISLAVLVLMFNDPNGAQNENGTNKYGKIEPGYVIQISSLSVFLILISFSLIIFAR